MSAQPEELPGGPIRTFWPSLPEPGSANWIKAVRRGRVPGHLPLSHSALARYDECPRRFKLERDPEIEMQETGPAAEAGKDFHAAAEARYLGEPPPAIQAPAEVWIQVMDQRELVDDMPLELEGLIGTEKNGGVLDFAWPYLVTRRDGSTEQVTVHVRCIIDRLHVSEDGRSRIVDYKTGFNVPKELGKREEGKLTWADPQLMLYNVAVLENLPWVWEFTGEQVQTQYGETKSFTFSLEEVQRFREFMRERIRRVIGDETMYPRPGPLCRRCPFSVAHCEAGREWVRAFGPITTVGELAKTGLALVALDAKRKQVYDAFRDALMEYGAPLELETGTWTLEIVNGRHGPYAKTEFKARKDENKRGRWSK